MPVDHPATEFDITLCGAGELDCDEVARVVNAAYTVYPFMKGPRTDPEMVAEEAGETGIFLLGRDAAGELIACAMVRPSMEVDWSYTEGAGGRGEDAMYFGLAAVAPGGQRSGLGRALLARAEEIAREAGFSRMVLTTLAEMGLVGYYSPQGYVTRDTRSFPAFEHWAIEIPHTLHVMEKTL